MPRVVLRAPFRSNEVGAIGVVETQFGTHLVRVNERADKLDRASNASTARRSSDAAAELLPDVTLEGSPLAAPSGVAKPERRGQSGSTD